MKKNEYYNHIHPLSLTKKLKLSALLLLLPIIQQILYRPTGIAEIIGSMSLNTLYSAFVTTFAIMSYRRCLYRIAPNGIKICSGIINRKRLLLPFDRIQTMIFHEDILSRLFNAAWVYFDTAGGRKNSADISVCLNRKTAYAVRKLIASKKTEKIRCSILNMLLMAAFWSNPVSGLLFSVPVVYHLKTIFGLAPNDLLSSVDTPIRHILPNISPAAEMLAKIMIIGWLVSFVVQFFKYANFTCCREGKYIVTSRGLASRTLICTKADGITAITIDHTLIMHLFRLKSASVFTIGSGKLKGDKSLIIPAEKEAALCRRLEEIVPMNTAELKTVSPKKGSVLSYLYAPLIAAAAYIFAAYFFISFGEFAAQLRAAAAVAAIPIIWWIIFRVYAFKTSFISICDNCAAINSYDRLTMRKFYIPFDKLQYITIKQNPFQKRKGCCNMTIYMYYEKTVKRTVRQLPFREATELAQLIRSHMRK